MKKYAFSLVSILAIVALVGCGDDDDNNGKTPDSGAGDTGTVYFDSGDQQDTGIVIPESGADSTVDGTTSTCDPSILGKFCSETVPCGEGHMCLLTTETGGVCTCDCTQDDPSTPLIVEDDCPDQANHTCGSVSMSDGSNMTLCFKYCQPTLGTNTCEGDIACHQMSGAYVGLMDKAVCMLSGCKTDADCPVGTSTVCDTTVADSCPTGQTCEIASAAEGVTEGRCYTNGKCDVASGLCDKKPATLSKQDAQVGDPCADDTECADNMRCLTEYDKSKYEKKEGEACTDNYTCCSGSCENGTCTKGLCTVDNRNGYCTILGCHFGATMPHWACPSGTTCFVWYNGGGCMKSCDLNDATGCRNNPDDLFGDYECRSWDMLSFGGVQAAGTPLCEPAANLPCHFLEASSLDCTVVGLQNNPSNMSCRSLDNQVLSNFDPTGFCLDDTSSGPDFRDPLPTP